jgi:hypothetical protein
MVTLLLAMIESSGRPIKEVLKELVKELGYQDPEEILILRLQEEIESLRGHIRWLERSNQELGEENHRLKGDGIGWNKTNDSR